MNDAGERVRPRLPLGRLAECLLLIAIVLLGATLRFGGLDWGLPAQLHPDEATITVEAYRLARDRSFETKAYNRPNQITIKANSILYRLLNDVYFTGELEVNYDIHFSYFYHISRMFTAILGVGMILLAYCIGRFFHARIALLAALLTAVFPSLVEHSHYITPDIPLAFFLMGVTLFALRYVRRASVGNLLGMVAFAVLATLEKYPGAIYCALIAAVVIACNLRSLGPMLRHGALAFFAYFLGMFLLSPVLFIDFAQVLEILKFESRTVQLAADGLGFLGNMWFYLSMFFRGGGMLLIAFALLGAVYCLREQQGRHAVLLGSCLFIVPLSLHALHWERWGVPEYANLLLICAAGMHLLLGLAKRHKGFRIPAMALCALSVANMLAGSMATTIGLMTRDTRIAAMGYCYEQGINKQNSFYEGYTALSPEGGNALYHQVDKKLIDMESPDESIRYILISEQAYLPYYAEPERYAEAVSFYNGVHEKYPQLKAFLPAGRRYSPWEPLSIWYAMDAVRQYRAGGMIGSGQYIFEIPVDKQ